MSARVTSSEISAMLAQRIDALVRELLPAGKKNGADWRCGSLAGEKGGSLAVKLSGQNTGNWTDHATGEFGDALDLVSACLTRGNSREAYRWAHHWLGLGDMGQIEIHRAHLIAEKPKRDEVADEIEGRRRAFRMWLDAAPVTDGSPVLSYLMGRGIDLSVFGRVSRSLRFSPAHYCNEVRAPLPAMLAAFSDLSGAHVATHQTWLEQDASGQWIKARLDVPKKIRGRCHGASIRLRNGASGSKLRDALPGEMILIGEGIETCLSVAVFCPEFRVLAAGSLGNMATIDLPDHVRRVTLLADNDDKDAAKRGLDRAVEYHLSQGREVRVARPPRGKDFNDAIR